MAALTQGGIFAVKWSRSLLFPPRVMQQGPGGRFVAPVGKSPDEAIDGGMSRWFPTLVGWVLGVTLAGCWS